MKKVFSILVLAVLASGIFVSCKSHEKCPAYSKSEKSKAHI
jgi:hypothetical protein